MTTDHVEKGQLRSRFGIVSAKVMRMAALSVGAKAVYALMASYADSHGGCFPKQATLAADLGMSRPWVNERIAELMAAGVLDQEHRGWSDTQLRRSSHYTITDDVRSSASAPVVADNVIAERDSDVAPDDSKNHHHDKQTRLAPRAGADADMSGGESQVVTLPQTISDDWWPKAETVEQAMALVPTDFDLTNHAELFAVRCRAKGYRYADFDAAWVSWAIQDAKAAAEKTRASRSTAQTRFDAWASVAVNLTAQRHQAA
jgi:hypothetical protein